RHVLHTFLPCLSHHSPSFYCLSLFFVLLRRPPLYPLFPYTTLFRSIPPLVVGSVLGAARIARRRPSWTIPLGRRRAIRAAPRTRSEEHTSELQSRRDLVCRLLLEKKKKKKQTRTN